MNESNMEWVPLIFITKDFHYITMGVVVVVIVVNNNIINNNIVIIVWFINYAPVYEFLPLH